MSRRFNLFLMLMMALAACDGAGRISTEVCFTTQHHEKVIPNITIYVILNQEEFPGYDVPDYYDLEGVSDAQGRYCFDNLPLGHHWFIGFGYDEEIRELVFGIMSLRLNLRNLAYDTILYVGEE